MARLDAVPEERPVAVDLTARRQGDGYWVLAANGGVFAFGAAQWFGSLSSFSGKIKVRKVRATPFRQRLLDPCRQRPRLPVR